LRERHPEAPCALTAVEPSSNSALPWKLAPFDSYERQGSCNPKEFNGFHPAEKFCGSAAREARWRRISPPAPYIVREHQHPRADGQPPGVERSVGETGRQRIRVPSGGEAEAQWVTPADHRRFIRSTEKPIGNHGWMPP
jgi:hypothetical protein